jgi:hypothetical protein
MIIWISLIVCLLGLVLYAFSNHPKVMVLARDCFWVGLLVFLLRWSGAIAPR